MTKMPASSNQDPYLSAAKQVAASANEAGASRSRAAQGAESSSGSKLADAAPSLIEAGKLRPGAPEADPWEPGLVSQAGGKALVLEARVAELQALAEGTAAKLDKLAAAKAAERAELQVNALDCPPA